MGAAGAGAGSSGEGDEAGGAEGPGGGGGGSSGAERRAGKGWMCIYGARVCQGEAVYFTKRMSKSER